nr:MAG TPA: hypothetical protein [Caudoviricetes sp.]
MSYNLHFLLPPLYFIFIVTHIVKKNNIYTKLFC